MYRKHEIKWYSTQTIRLIPRPDSSIQTKFFSAKMQNQKTTYGVKVFHFTKREENQHAMTMRNDNYQSINRTIEQSIKRTVNQAIDRSINQSSDRSVGRIVQFIP